MKFTNVVQFFLLSLLLLLFFFVTSKLFSNSLIDCCGLFSPNSVAFSPPDSPRFVAPVQRGLENRFNSPNSNKPGFIKPNSKQNRKFAIGEKSLQKRKFVPSVREKFEQANQVPQFIPANHNTFVPQKKCSPTVRNTPPASPAMFYYAPRVKSIRVSSPPNIEGWERSMREEMRLNGRSKHTVDRLLARIQKYYADNTITAHDYAPGNEDYAPNSASRKFAETRIRRSIESMADFYRKSGNPQMDSGKSSNGSRMIKGQLAFINTQLDKLGKDRVEMEELREIVGLKLTPSLAPNKAFVKIENPAELNPPADIQLVEEFLPHVNNLIAKQDLPGEEVNKDLINDKIEEIYKSFATWLADNNKEFPSLDPQVDAFTLRYFEQVNQELRGLGKLDTMQIFREKTLAHLDEILDNRGLDMEGMDRAPQLVEPDLPKEEDPVFRGPSLKKPSYVHLASLPGKVVSSKKKTATLPGNRNQFDNQGNQRVFRVMNNLPGKAVF
jgi:hypothetical protein